MSALPTKRRTGPFGIFLAAADFIAPKNIRVPNIKPPVGNRGIGPSLGLTSVRLVARREMAFFTVRFGGGLDQGKVPIFSVKIQAAIGIAYRRRCDAALLPFNLAADEICAYERLSVVPYRSCQP